MLTITRKDLLLTISDNVIPAMGSSDVPVKFVNDTETYVDFLIEPRVGYYINGCPKSVVCEYSSNTIKIPAEVFKNKGILVIAIALIDNADSNHIEVTKELALEVTPAPNGTVILPATETWQTAVNNLVEQLYNQDYKPLYDQALNDINEAVQTANTASENADLASQNVQTAYENLGDYKVENGVIYFKKADGTYNEQGITLAGQSSVLDGNGNVILSGNITPNDNLLTNSDYRYGVINQKGQTSYTGILYGIDMWLGVTVSTKITVNKGYISLLGKMRQFIHTIPFKTGDKYTVCVNVNGTDNVWTFDYKEGITQHAFSNFTVELNMDTSNDRILFQITSTSSINIYYVKMEKGQYFTGMPAWNGGEELIKCMYLFEKKIINVMCSQFDATTCYASIPYSTPKIKTPSVTGKCTWVGSNNGQGIGETKITKLEVTNIQDEYVDIKVTHESANFGQYSRNVFVELYIDAYNH